MKQIIVLFFLVTGVPVGALAQGERVVSLIHNDVYELNGGVRSSMGGRSRIVLPVDIPFNTKMLIYAVTAKRPGEAIESNFDFALAVGTLLATGNLALSTAASRVEIPAGTQTVEVNLIPTRPESQHFLLKNDNLWRRYPDYSREACQSCQVAIPFSYSLPNPFFIGIKNPSALNPVVVVINVVAIVREY